MLISGIARDIPVIAFFKRVIPGYPHLCILKIAYSWLLNAQTAHTVIWKSSWKHYFSSLLLSGLVVAVQRLAPSPGVGLPAPASAPSPAGGIGGLSAGHAPFFPAAGACCAGAALLNSSPLLTLLLQGWSERSPDAPSKPMMSPEKRPIVVKSVFSEVWFCCNSQHKIIN